MTKHHEIMRVCAAAYTVPTDAPEADGTKSWDSTTLVVAYAHAANERGLGYTYADKATSDTINQQIAPAVVGCDAMAIPAAWMSMRRNIRNMGQPGVDSMAIAAVDVALWDLKAKLLGTALVNLLGQARPGAPVYGSGGFTTYSKHQLQDQLAGWAAMGITKVKMKVGTHPDRDLERVKQARDAVGPHVELMVDANGAYSRNDLEGLRLLRDRAPGGMEIAAGEYGYSLPYFRRMLEAEAVDVLQADASRCAGITGFLGASALAESRLVPLSAHCAPSLHMHPGCSAVSFRDLEYFHDHARIERLLFDGFQEPKNGVLAADLSRPGLGLEFKEADAARFAVN
jgi:L-alanine-DL-glutamate epimerase-like enolase superfamily enzyme